MIFRHKSVGLPENPLTTEIERINSSAANKNIEPDVARLLEENRKRQQEHFDKSRREAPLLNVGDLVLIKHDPPSTGESRK